MAEPTKPVLKVSDRLTQVRINKKLHTERNVVVTEREAGGLLTDRGQIIDRPPRRSAERWAVNYARAVGLESSSDD